MLKLSRLAWLGPAAVLLPTVAVAQDYPTRAIKLIVPFPAGGPADTIGRVYAEKLHQLLGQPVIVDNRSGAGGITGGTKSKVVPSSQTSTSTTGK